ncbi:hypothetical protein SPF06_09720 [Sinomonas sp. JGH33]|uniref:Uncharacterized protein n=1 Tax=Sinomonas terricola TaxID=3110330 RepID=A0ABU5T5P6_9MICC|nr:hypothetical protein [Sinomonas sp. JGH33]MEA5454996.1 hypothetical protein [Sinomonas sp. JGH33]
MTTNTCTAEPTVRSFRPAPRRVVRPAHGPVSRARGASPSSVVRRVAARVWAWLAERAREARDIDARLSARRDEDAARLSRSGAWPARIL